MSTESPNNQTDTCNSDFATTSIPLEPAVTIQKLYYLVESGFTIPRVYVSAERLLRTGMISCEKGSTIKYQAPLRLKEKTLQKIL